MKDIKYPIGQFQSTKEAQSNHISVWINDIKSLPENLKETVSSLSEEQLETPYRNGGWTLRQVIHHIADSHLNGYVRIKLALTEDQPTIKAYDQEIWAELADSTMPIGASLELIDGLHQRWAYLLESLDESQLNRKFIHPEDGTLKVKNLIELYAWHGKHHLAHITNLKKQKNWD